MAMVHDIQCSCIHCCHRDHRIYTSPPRLRKSYICTTLKEYVYFQKRFIEYYLMRLTRRRPSGDIIFSIQLRYIVSRLISNGESVSLHIPLYTTIPSTVTTSTWQPGSIFSASSTTDPFSRLTLTSIIQLILPTPLSTVTLNGAANWEIRRKHHVLPPRHSKDFIVFGQLRIVKPVTFSYI